jgi:hypothetical protein
MRTLILPIVALLHAFATPALACWIPPPPPMTDEEKAAEAAKRYQEFVERAKSARAIADVRALSNSGINYSSASFEIIRIYQGELGKNRRIKLRTVGASLCGAGGVKRGERGIIIISAEDPKHFNGFLWTDRIELLRKKGLIAD